MLKIHLFFRVLATILLTHIFPFYSATAQVSSCNDVIVADLIAGQYSDVGDVSVCNYSDNLYVQYSAVDGWTVTETHLAVDKRLELIPQTGSGNPKIGHFTYRRTYSPGVQGDTFIINLTEAGFAEGDELIIAAHAVVQLTDDLGNVIQQETGWGEGVNFPGRSWATYISYTVQAEQSDEGGDGGGDGSGGGR